MGIIGGSKSVLLGTAAAAALVASVGSAFAGGFAIREQSTTFLGSAWAGSAAGGSLSSMFWNPAALSTLQGTNTESNYTDLLLSLKDEARAPTPTLGLGASSGDLGGNRLIPASYFGTQLTKDLYVGVGINSPLGLSTEASNPWAGQTMALSSSIFTLNVNPNFAYRVAPGITVGAGMQVEYIKARLDSAAAAAPGAPISELKGEDTAVGFTAGVHLQPLSGTQVGIGFRSSINHEIEGGITVNGTTIVPAINVPLKTPDVVTASLRQTVTPSLDLLLTGEWSNWSRVSGLNVFNSNTGALITTASKELGWHDGYMVSGGFEYRYNPVLTLRTGVAWEKSPVQNASERLASLPDSDRIWVSLGAGYKWSDTITLDAAYGHIFAKDGQIDRTENGLRVVADTSGHADLFALSLKMKLGADPAPAPLK